MMAMILRAEPLRYALLQALRPLNRALCYRGPFSSVVLADIPEPKLPSPEWVMIKTRLCGFCGSDLNLIMMNDSPRAMPFTSFPCVPGHEIYGEIVETGSEAGEWRPGDRVALLPGLSCEARDIDPPCRACREGKESNCENFAEGSIAPGLFTGICRDINGGFSPYLAAYTSQLYRVPDNVSPEEAVMTEPLAVSLQAVLDNRPQDNDRILVIGCGVIGLLVIRSIRALGIKCHITATDPSPYAGQKALESGADSLISGDLVKEAVKITSGRIYKPLLGPPLVMGGFEKIYDTVASEKTLTSSMDILAAGGVLSMLGIGKKVTLDMTPLWLKLQTIQGCYAYRQVPGGQKGKTVFATALEMIGEGKISVTDMVTHQYSLQDFREMIKVNLSKTEHRAIKTAIRFD